MFCLLNLNYSSNFDYYRGSEPFSETETQAIRDFVIDKQFLLSVAYHSSRSGRVSEMVIYSWDWEETKKSPDYPVIDSAITDAWNKAVEKGDATKTNLFAK